MSVIIVGLIRLTLQNYNELSIKTNVFLCLFQPITYRHTCVFNLNGEPVMRNATQEGINSLSPGIYIIGGKKVMVK